MTAFHIQSSTSSAELRFFDIHGDYFRVKMTSTTFEAVGKVYAYTDSYTFADFMEFLAAHERPWADHESWESLEGELKFTATCTSVGQVMFEIELHQLHEAETWSIQSQIRSDFGALPILAKSARKFFGNSPN